ncbi:MAG: SurA N-terminal domain-containing protein [Bacteroidota bacterium]
MSALRMIRQNMALIVIVIAIALLGFILTDLFTGLSRIIGGPPSVGTVAGKSITYSAYEDRVQDWVGNNPVQGEKQRNEFRDRAWTDIVSEILYANEFDEIGLSVSDDELFDMFAGENQAPLVAQNFPGMTPDQIQQQLKLLVNDPNARPQLKAFETYLARTRGQEKLANMVKSAYVGSQESAKRKHRDQNRKVNLSFLAVNYTQVPDSTVPVSDAEISSYISAHPKQYEQNAETYIRYARFVVNPSPEDTAATIERLMKYASNFQKTETDSNFTSNKSSLPYTSPDYRAMNNLPITIQDSVLGKADKSLIGPVQEDGFFKLYKIVGSETAETPSYKIKAIQIRPSGGDDAATAEAKSKAATVASAAKADFEAARLENAGSNIGWYRPGQYGEDFDEALKGASRGQVIGPIESNNVFHIVYVEDIATKTYDIAQVERVIRASDATKKRIYQEANQFAGLAQTKGDINQAGQEANVIVLESGALTPTTNEVAGLDGGGRDIVLWALGAEVGSQSSEVFAVANNYVYAQVSSRKNEGLKSVEEVRESVAPLVRNEKKADMIVNKLQAVAGQDLNAMKDAYGAGAYVSTANDVSFETIPGSGSNPLSSDPYVLGRAMGMAQGETSVPIEGKNGVYILQVTGITEAAEADEVTLNNLRQNETTSGSSRLQFGVQTILEEAGGVEDTRAEAYAKLKGYR